MPDIKRYWSLVAEQRAKLFHHLGVDTRGLSQADIVHMSNDARHAVFITSIDRPLEGYREGAISGVTVDIAAKRIIEQTHRLATPEEVEKFHADQAAREKQCAEIEFRRQREKGGVTITLTPEQAGIDPPKIERARKGTN